MTNAEIFAQIKNDFDGCEADTWDFCGNEINGYECSSGASKVAMWCENFGNKIVKLSFGEDEEGSSFSKSGGDFLEDEIHLYQEAEDAGLAQFFAKVEFLGTISLPYVSDSVVGVYIQDKVDKVFEYLDVCNADERTSYLREQKIYNTLWKENTNLYDMGAYYFIRKYGVKKYRDLCLFIRANGIHDLHAANFGVMDDGSFVIFDYSGYNGGYGSQGGSYESYYDEYTEEDQ